MNEAEKTLVEELRKYAMSWAERAGSKAIVDEAADEITRLTSLLSERDELLAALRPGSVEEDYIAQLSEEIKPGNRVFASTAMGVLFYAQRVQQSLARIDTLSATAKEG